MRSFLVAGTAAALISIPATANAEPQQVPFETFCTPTDPSLAELSGLTSINGTLYAIGDSGTDHRVAVLDDACAVTRWLDVPVDPYDIEDLGSYGGDLWLSDTGDNLRRRDTVALTRLDPESGSGELHRLVYPDGPHDAETLLIEPGGRPMIVTKDPSGASGIYAPAGIGSVDELPSPGPTPLEKIGELSFDRTDTPGGPPIILGSILATGGAVSADGAVAAVRTYTDLYLYPVVDGDVASALAGEPTVIALPSQPQGEALAFVADGSVLAASESAGGSNPPIRILRGATSLVQTDASTVSPESSSDGRWPIGAITVAVVLAFISVGYVFGLRRRR